MISILTISCTQNSYYQYSYAVKTVIPDSIVNLVNQQVLDSYNYKNLDRESLSRMPSNMQEIKEILLEAYQGETKEGLLFKSENKNVFIPFESLDEEQRLIFFKLKKNKTSR